MKTIRPMAFAGIITTCAGLIAISDGSAHEPAAEPTSEVVLASEVEWTHLNPARGDKAPKAGTLWGDRNGAGATGFLLKPADGFESPPHIHNVSYRGLVISGLIHNDDPDAADMWMPAGSFWTQPKGEVHITAAKGSNTLAYIEIDEGPYLVHPVEKAFHGEERPINVDESNIVWLDASSVTWIDQPGVSESANAAQVAFLWGNRGDDRLNGTLIRLPAGFVGGIRAHGSTFRAVVIGGRPQVHVPSEADAKGLEPGSYFGSKGASTHRVSSDADGETIIYVRTNGAFEVIPASPKN